MISEVDLHDSQNSNTSKNSNSTAMQSYDDSLNHRDTIGTDVSENNSKSPTRTATMISEVDLHDSQNSNTSKNSNSTAMQSYDDSLNHRDTIGTDVSRDNSKSPTRTATMISE